MAVPGLKRTTGNRRNQKQTKQNGSWIIAASICDRRRKVAPCVSAWPCYSPGLLTTKEEKKQKGAERLKCSREGQKEREGEY